MGGDRAIGAGIAMAVATVLVLLPALIVPLYYLFANVYAIVVGTDFSSETASVAVLLIGLVGVVALLVVGLASGVALLGRALSPKGRSA